jgi:acetoin utilization protein AcuB
MRDVMTPSPQTIESDQKLDRAHRMMQECGVRHLPVIRGGKLAGVVTQRDLYFLESISGVDIAVDKVGDAMTPDAYTVRPDESLRDVAQTMAEHKYGCAVVVDGERILGIFTVTDALRHIAARS